MRGGGVRRLTWAATGVLFLMANSAAQEAGRSTDAPATVREEVLRADAAMFRAFDEHDLEGLMKWFSADVEFFHDSAGLQHHEEVLAGFKGLFAKNDGIRRYLLLDSVEVYPIPRYGAIEVGTHRFCHVEEGREVCGNFKFLQVWKKVGESWQVTRVVSYGH